MADVEYPWDGGPVARGQLPVGGRRWMTEQTDYGSRVYPLDDTMDHQLDNMKCPCGPASELVRARNGALYVMLTHEAKDGRP